MLIWQVISLLYKLSIAIGVAVCIKLVWSLVIIPIIRIIKQNKKGSGKYDK